MAYQAGLVVSDQITGAAGVCGLLHVYAHVLAEARGIRKRLAARSAHMRRLAAKWREVLGLLVPLPGPAPLVGLVLEADQLGLHVHGVGGVGHSGAMSARDERRLLILHHVVVGEGRALVHVRLAVHAHTAHRVAAVAAYGAAVGLGGRVALDVLHEPVVALRDILAVRTAQQRHVRAGRLTEVQFEQAVGRVGVAAVGTAVRPAPLGVTVGRVGPRSRVGPRPCVHLGGAGQRAGPV